MKTKSPIVSPNKFRRIILNEIINTTPYRKSSTPIDWTLNNFIVSAAYSKKIFDPLLGWKGRNYATRFRSQEVIKTR